MTEPLAPAAEPQKRTRAPRRPRPPGYTITVDMTPINAVVWDLPESTVAAWCRRRVQNDAHSEPLKDPQPSPATRPK